MTRKLHWKGSLASIVAVAGALVPGMVLAAPASAAAPTPVIIDQDMFSSVDDVGALATAFSLEHRGEANVIAITLDTRTSRPVVATDTWKCAAAIEHFYGSTAPIGSQTPLGTPPNDSSSYAGQCGQLAPANAPAPGDAVSVMTQALNAQPDDSVVIVCTGYERNLDDLLQAQPALVARKVKQLVIMGGAFTTQSDGTIGSNLATPPGENNLNGDIAAATDVAAHWPTPIVWSGQEIGDVSALDTGSGLSSHHPADSPVRVAYEAFSGGPNKSYSSYDLTAVYHAIRPADQLLTESSPGTNVVSRMPAPPYPPLIPPDPSILWDYGVNVFTPGPGDQSYLKLTDANAPTLQGRIEALLDWVPPKNTTAPSISGTFKEGERLSASTGTWTPTPDSYKYQWLRCDSSGSSCAVTGATSDTYTLDSSDVGETIEVRVTATQGGGDSDPAPSDPTPVVLPAAPSTSRGPTLSGAAQEGQTLSESHAPWNPIPTSFSYQWQSCDGSGNNCSAIPGATGQSYKLTAGDVGHTIQVQETATNAGGVSSPATSHPTPVVTAAPTVTPPAPPTGSTVTPPPAPPVTGPSGPAPVSSANIRAMLTQAVAVQGPAGKLRAVLKQGGYSFTATAPSAGRLVISWYTQIRGKKVLVAKVTVTFTRAGAKKVKIALTASGRQLVRTAGRMTITVNAAFTPTGQPTTSTTKTLMLRR